MKLTWIGPTLLAACIAGVWLLGGAAWSAVLVVALAVTAVLALSRRARFL